MKTVCVIVALLAAVNALPQPETEINLTQERLVSDAVASALEDVSQQIRDAGLDPWSFEKFDAEFELPVPTVFSASGILQNVLFTGASNIVINSINYGLISSRLTLDVSLPEIAVSIDRAGFDFKILGHEFVGEYSGRLAIIEPRISGAIQMNVGIITGIFVRDVNLVFDLEAIRYNGNVNFLGVDYTSLFTDFVSNTIPTAVKDAKADIDELVEIIAWQVIEQIF